jgi:hypothetical protein
LPLETINKLACSMLNAKPCKRWLVEMMKTLPVEKCRWRIGSLTVSPVYHTMEYPKKTIDSVSVTRATDLAHQYSQDCIKRSLDFLADPRRKERLKELECKACYYIRTNRVGGASMTTQTCGICGSPEMYGSTNTDVLCAKCASEHQLCKYCGGDVLMRPRRIFDNQKGDNAL